MCQIGIKFVILLIFTQGTKSLKSGRKCLSWGYWTLSLGRQGAALGGKGRLGMLKGDATSLPCNIYSNCWEHAASPTICRKFGEAMVKFSMGIGIREAGVSNPSLPPKLYQISCLPKFLKIHTTYHSWGGSIEIDPPDIYVYVVLKRF